MNLDLSHAESYHGILFRILIIAERQHVVFVKDKLIVVLAVVCPRLRLIFRHGERICRRVRYVERVLFRCQLICVVGSCCYALFREGSVGVYRNVFPAAEYVQSYRMLNVAFVVYLREVYTALKYAVVSVYGKDNMAVKVPVDNRDCFESACVGIVACPQLTV